MMPEQEIIAVTLGNGAVVIVTFVTKELDRDGNVLSERQPTTEALAARLGRGDFTWRSLGRVADREGLAKLKATHLPMRLHRAAWRDDGQKIWHDMAVARDLHREHIRFWRQKMWADLDAGYMRADEIGDAALKRAVVELKQRLRDATTDPRIEAASTIEELAAMHLPDGTGW